MDPEYDQQERGFTQQEKKSFFQSYGITPEAIKKKEKFLFLDTGFFGSIIQGVRKVFKELYGEQIDNGDVDRAIDSRLILFDIEYAEMLDIKERLSSFPAQLPYGVLKQVEIARALISDPKIILFDEPFK